ncbi:MAG TPA: glyceraldehyde-3-phosphate dehydrogenase [Saprospiraceae bacterium]|nr:glyceraldehyde-3-phosphate dehydrogenase [Saprospiraceae bacterium]
MSLVSQKETSELALKDWREKEKNALELSKLVGDLRFDRSIELVLFRKDLYDVRPSQIISDHLFAKNYIDKPLDLDLSLDIARIISKMDKLVPARIDIGKLASEWEENKSKFQQLEDFIHEELHGGVAEEEAHVEARDVVLYGFGRIGRLVARRLISSTGRGEQLRLRAIVVRPGMKNQYEEVHKRLALLESDSIHGSFPGAIEVTPDGTEAIINGNRVRMIFASAPSEINYEDYGIRNALLIDNTGMFDTREKLSVHFRPGISEIILTAPGKDIPNIVVGVNTEEADNQDENTFSAASCTTNAIVPIIQVIDQAFGIAKGHLETVHAYTSDQNLLDNFHKKPRRGRGAPINMVITSTGAASAVAKVLPHLKGKLTGNAVRVPVPNVSLAILNLTLEKPSTLEEILGKLRHASLYGDLVEQLQYSTSNEYVSSNAVGTTCASVVDAPSTILSADGKTVTIYAWYDNEFGYTCQVVRLAKHVANVRRYTYY